MIEKQGRNGFSAVGFLFSDRLLAGVGFAPNPRVWLQQRDIVSVEVEELDPLENPLINESQ